MKKQTDIYDKNKNMVLGLIWILILQYQIKEKRKVIDWVLQTANEYTTKKGLHQITLNK